jgi:hypothetical protein
MICDLTRSFFAKTGLRDDWEVSNKTTLYDHLFYAAAIYEYGSQNKEEDIITMVDNYLKHTLHK